MRRPPLPWVAAAPRSRSDRDRYDERGDTLLEILMTLIVLSIAVVALIVTFATGISASADHKNLAANDVILRQVEQQAFYLVQQQSSPLYTSCASIAGGQYASLTNSATYNNLPTGYSVTMNNPIQYWDPTANGGTGGFDSNCAPDSPQLISLTLNSTNESSATTTFVVDDLGAGPLGPLGPVTVNPPSAVQGTSNLALTLSGTGFASNLTVSINLATTGITLNSYAFVSSTLIDLNVSISATAQTAQADAITVTDPASSTYPVQTANGSFTVIKSTPTGMHVSGMSATDFFLPEWPIVVITVEDGNGKPVNHAYVTGSWSTTIGGITTNFCTTNGSGTCYILYDLFGFPTTGGSAKYTVGNVMATGETYTPVTVNPPYGNPPALTVSWPGF